jgi:hypothetical protein
MSCARTRLQIGADPSVATPGLEAHVAGCPACARFREEMRSLDVDIRRALQEPPRASVSRRQRLQPLWRQWALAASVLLALAAVLGLWVLRPSQTRAREVVAHVQAEPESWLATQLVSTASIAAALRGSGAELGVTSDKVTYAHTCWFRGRYVPHLVVQTAHGPVTVMILSHERVLVRRSFHEAGMSGVIVPAGTGSIAVLSRDGGDMNAMAGQMQHEIRWLPPAN